MMAEDKSRPRITVAKLVDSLRFGVLIGWLAALIEPRKTGEILFISGLMVVAMTCQHVCNSFDPER